MKQKAHHTEVTEFQSVGKNRSRRRSGRRKLLRARHGRDSELRLGRRRGRDGRGRTPWPLAAVTLLQTSLGRAGTGRARPAEEHTAQELRRRRRRGRDEGDEGGEHERNAGGETRGSAAARCAGGRRREAREGSRRPEAREGSTRTPARNAGGCRPAGASAGVRPAPGS